MLVILCMCLLYASTAVLGMEQKEEKDRQIKMLLGAYAKEDLAEMVYEKDENWSVQNNLYNRAVLLLQSKSTKIESLEIENQSARDRGDKYKDKFKAIRVKYNDLKIDNESLSNENSILKEKSKKLEKMVDKLKKTLKGLRSKKLVQDDSSEG